MIRSLRTGVSGILSNQIKMDVIGNNIANVNTLAYKRGRAAFNEVLGQQLLGVGRMSGGSGVNPAYVGLGTSIGSIDQNWLQGAIENTNRTTDLAINGDGFFIAKSDIGNIVTRAGNFAFNSAGKFVTSNGLSVQGWKYDDNGMLVTGVLQDIQIDPDLSTPPQQTSTFTIGSNISAEEPVGTVRPISSPAYDDSGKPHNLTIELEKIEELGSGVEPAVSEWMITVLDENGNEILDGGGASQTAGNRIYFDESGTLCQSDGSALTGDVSYGFVWDMQGDGTFDPMTIDIGGFTRNGMTAVSGSTTVSVQDQDGFQAGTITGTAISPEGVLELNFSNGQQKQMYKLAIGQVTNPHGLEQLGDNFYGLTSASGELQVRQAGRDTRAVVLSGSLEMSNVDLAVEFTDMIVAQRGFQAAARVITSSDELLQETVQLKR